MQFGNEYEMTRKRYDLWCVAKLYCTPIFWIYFGVFFFSMFAFIYMKNVGAAQKWQTLAAFMMFISVYRGVAFKFMATDKQYRLTKKNVFKDKPWMCKVEVNDGGVKVSANGKVMTHLKWDQVKACKEGKAVFDLTCETSMGEDKARLNKASFTKGDVDSFRQYMKENHPEVPYLPLEKKWDRRAI